MFVSHAALSAAMGQRWSVRRIARMRCWTLSLSEWFSTTTTSATRWRTPSSTASRTSSARRCQSRTSRKWATSTPSCSSHEETTRADDDDEVGLCGRIEYCIQHLRIRDCLLTASIEISQNMLHKVKVKTRNLNVWLFFFVGYYLTNGENRWVCVSTWISQWSRQPIKTVG